MTNTNTTFPFTAGLPCLEAIHQFWAQLREQEHYNKPYGVFLGCDTVCGLVGATFISATRPKTITSTADISTAVTTLNLSRNNSHLMLAMFVFSKLHFVQHNKSKYTYTVCVMNVWIQRILNDMPTQLSHL